MCGRYTVFTEAEIIEMREIVNQISKKLGAQAVKTGEVSPTDLAPIIRLIDNVVEVDCGIWGFPGFGADKRPVINARSETAFEKKMFAGPLLRSRCVVPSTGFYEWTHEGKKAKDKYLFRQSDTPMLYFAGIMDRFVGTNGQQHNHFVILTQKPNQCISPYHDRMPVIIQKNEISRWLRYDSFMQEVFAREGPELLSIQAG